MGAAGHKFRCPACGTWQWAHWWESVVACCGCGIDIMLSWNAR